MASTNSGASAPIDPTLVANYQQAMQRNALNKAGGKAGKLTPAQASGDKDSDFWNHVDDEAHKAQLGANQDAEAQQHATWRATQNFIWNAPHAVANSLKNASPMGVGALAGSMGASAYKELPALPGASDGNIKPSDISDNGISGWATSRAFAKPPGMPDDQWKQLLNTPQYQRMLKWSATVTKLGEWIGPNALWGPLSGALEGAGVASPLLKPVVQNIAKLATAGKFIMDDASALSTSARILNGAATGGTFNALMQGFENVARGRGLADGQGSNIGLGMILGAVGGFFDAPHEQAIMKSMPSMPTVWRDGIDKFMRIGGDYATAANVPAQQARQRLINLMRGQGRSADAVWVMTHHGLNPEHYTSPITKWLREASEATARGRHVRNPLVVPSADEVGRALQSANGMAAPSTSTIGNLLAQPNEQRMLPPPFDTGVRPNEQAQMPPASAFEGSQRRRIGFDPSAPVHSAESGPPIALEEHTGIKPGESAQMPPASAWNEAPKFPAHAPAPNASPFESTPRNQIPFDRFTPKVPTSNTPLGRIGMVLPQVIKQPTDDFRWLPEDVGSREEKALAVETPYFSVDKMTPAGSLNRGEVEYSVPSGASDPSDVPSAPRVRAIPRTGLVAHLLNSARSDDPAAWRASAATKQPNWTHLTRAIMNGTLEPREVGNAGVAGDIASRLAQGADRFESKGDLARAEQYREHAARFAAHSDTLAHPDAAPEEPPESYVRSPESGNIVRAVASSDNTTDLIDERGRVARLANKDVTAPVPSIPEMPHDAREVPDEIPLNKGFFMVKAHSEGTRYTVVDRSVQPWRVTKVPATRYLFHVNEGEHTHGTLEFTTWDEGGKLKGAVHLRRTGGDFRGFTSNRMFAALRSTFKGMGDITGFRVSGISRDLIARSEETPADLANRLKKLETAIGQDASGTSPLDEASTSPTPMPEPMRERMSNKKPLC